MAAGFLAGLFYAADIGSVQRWRYGRHAARARIRRGSGRAGPLTTCESCPATVQLPRTYPATVHAVRPASPGLIARPSTAWPPRERRRHGWVRWWHARGTVSFSGASSLRGSHVHLTSGSSRALACLRHTAAPACALAARGVRAAGRGDDCRARVDGLPTRRRAGRAACGGQRCRARRRPARAAGGPVISPPRHMVLYSCVRECERV